MKNNAFGRYSTAALVIGSIIGTYFFSRPRKSFLTSRLDRKQQRKLDRNLTTPANETFGIVWPVIYTGTIGLVVHQALPSQADNPRYEQAQNSLRLNYLMNAVFGYFFARKSQEYRVGAGLTTIALLPAALKLHQDLEIGQTEVPQPESTLRKFVSQYAGWLTAASVISVTNLLLEAGIRTRSDVATRWAMGVLGATAGLGITVSRQLNDPYYLATLVAGFAGIAAKQADRNAPVAGIAGACALFVTGEMVWQLKEQKRLSAETQAISERATPEEISNRTEDQPINTKALSAQEATQV